ncbi:hypothetical protein BDV18DRAFT_151524 [Aspergillus unguis]
MSLPSKSPRIKDPATLHQCPHCDRTYERPDHLARHVNSHRNERAFQCPTCQRGDVLQRHQLIHTGGTPIKNYRDRAIEACQQCAAAKSSCDNSSPCRRCQRKGKQCIRRKSHGHRRSRTTQSYPEETSPGLGDELNIDEMPTSLLDHSQQTYQTPLSFGNGSGAVYSPAGSVSAVPFPTNTSDCPTDAHESFPDLTNFPAFFENVMMPSNIPPENGAAQQPRGVFDFMCDSDFASLDGGLFGQDVLMDLDQILEYNPSPATTSSNPDISTEEQITKRRVAAFRKSLWLWVPEKNQTGFSEDRQIPLRDGDMIGSISSLHKTRLEALNIRGKLTSQMRDNIFQLVLATGGSRLTVSSFPTAESLDALIKIGISKRTETDAWIHPYTLYRQDSRPELLTALVAAGCVCCVMPSVAKAGVLLLEIVRVSLAQLVESDNSVLRDLQYFQASMMWLDIGVFCGYQRKMQIAESNLQPLCTALRRAGAFDRSFYTEIQPDSGLDSYSIAQLWSEWVRQESLIRLAYHLFEHDVEVAAAMNRPGLTSYTEFTLPFPSARDLWLAPTAVAWKDLWMTKYSYASRSALSLRDLLADPSILEHLPDNVDAAVAKSALLHGLMSQVWAFRQQASLMDSCTDARATTRLWLQSRQDDLLSSMTVIQKALVDAPTVSILFSEFALMHVHVSFDSIQRFAGQFGETEARREYPKLRDWSSTKEGRSSIWHAAQVLRTARTVLPFQLRGFDSLAIYHAVLVLWVFGLLRCGEMHANVTISSKQSSPVRLDGVDRGSIKAFVDHDIGLPGLTLDSGPGDNFCPLTSPRLVMDVGRQVFESNYLGAMDYLPPVIDNLRNLIRELGSLP